MNSKPCLRCAHWTPDGPIDKYQWIGQCSQGDPLIAGRGSDEDVWPGTLEGETCSEWLDASDDELNTRLSRMGRA